MKTPIIDWSWIDFLAWFASSVVVYITGRMQRPRS